MGLSAKRQKQRIPKDPRNLGWADDAARFGQTYLSKLGWDPSKGLGVAGDGRTDYVKVSQKLDALGIGGSRKQDVDGASWKQNKDFEDVLKRLNESAGSPCEGDSEDVPGIENDSTIREETTTDKRKRTETKEHRDSASKKRRKGGTGSWKHDSMDRSVPTLANPPAGKTLPHRAAYRARAIASKSLALTSAVALSEILGVEPAKSSSARLPSAPSIPTGPSEITTSTQSVTDYFQAKLAVKAAAKIASAA